MQGCTPWYLKCSSRHRHSTFLLQLYRANKVSWGVRTVFFFFFFVNMVWHVGNVVVVPSNLLSPPTRSLLALSQARSRHHTQACPPIVGFLRLSILSSTFLSPISSYQEVMRYSTVSPITTWSFRHFSPFVLPLVMKAKIGPKQHSLPHLPVPAVEQTGLFQLRTNSTK